jgi:hypothetical protein
MLVELKQFAADRKLCATFIEEKGYLYDEAVYSLEVEYDSVGYDIAGRNKIFIINGLEFVMEDAEPRTRIKRSRLRKEDCRMLWKNLKKMGFEETA